MAGGLSRIDGRGAAAAPSPACWCTLFLRTSPHTDSAAGRTRCRIFLFPTLPSLFFWLWPLTALFAGFLRWVGSGESCVCFHGVFFAYCFSPFVIPISFFSVVDCVSCCLRALSCRGVGCPRSGSVLGHASAPRRKRIFSPFGLQPPPQSSVSTDTPPARAAGKDSFSSKFLLWKTQAIVN